MPEYELSNQIFYSSEVDSTDQTVAEWIQKAVVARPSGNKRARAVDLSQLAKMESLYGWSITSLLLKHANRGDVEDNGAAIRCLNIREARSEFSAVMAESALKFITSSRGDNNEQVQVMISLSELIKMLDRAHQKVSIVAAMSASDELPVAEPIKLRTTKRSSGPNILSAQAD
ncbi:hypothetical protein [uncultured Thalassospira sp.]|uniref:hypothetical protein n=1 Tax=uncultured Thalassospira sp. TaxID=404382 RepID=UPI00258D82FD|nr:hypothetical protein [uncultured Thalassospira sp.]